jgi:hypothetical protein
MRAAALIGALSLALAVAGCATAPQGADCDRDCLIDVADAYFGALVAHDPSQIPLADDVAFVENLERMEPGEGLWEAALSGPTRFRIDVPDPVAGEIGVLAMIKAERRTPFGAVLDDESVADGERIEKLPTLVALRLKVESGRITEAEHIVARSINEANLANLQTPRAGFLTPIPKGARLPEAELRRIGASYYDALDDNDGHLAPFAEDCARFENGGMASANPSRLSIPVDSLDGIGRYGCTDQLSTGVFSYIDTIDDRRVFAADPVMGLAIGFSHFHHGMKKKYAEVELPGFPDIHRIELNFDAFDLPAAHVFKIGPEGEIHEIEATGVRADYNSPTGWE